MATHKFEPTEPVYTDGDDEFGLNDFGLIMRDQWNGKVTVILLKEDVKAFSEWLNAQLEN